MPRRIILFPIEPRRGAEKLRRARAALAKALRRRRGVAEARREIVRITAGMLAHDLRRARAAAGRAATPDLFDGVLS